MFSKYYRNNMPSAFARIGNKLNQQKDTRQATFLFRRGLKVINIAENKVMPQILRTQNVEIN